MGFIYKEETLINKNQVIVHYKVSEGLSKYEYVVRRYKEFDNVQIHNKNYEYETKR